VLSVSLVSHKLRVTKKRVVMGTSNVLTAKELAEIMVEYWGWCLSYSEASFLKQDDIFVRVIRGVSDELRDEAQALAWESIDSDR
jgi:hypothetical protein